MFILVISGFLKQGLSAVVQRQAAESFRSCAKFTRLAGEPHGTAWPTDRVWPSGREIEGHIGEMFCFVPERRFTVCSLDLRYHCVVRLCASFEAVHRFSFGRNVVCHWREPVLLEETASRY
jgi:hypothetical protein